MHTNYNIKRTTILTRSLDRYTSVVIHTPPSGLPTCVHSAVSQTPPSGLPTCVHSAVSLTTERGENCSRVGYKVSLGLQFLGTFRRF